MMAILTKACKPDNFELHNSLKLSFTNTWDLRSKFIDCESFFESNSPDILALWDKPGWVSWFWQFLCERLTSLIWKDSSAHMHGLTVYVKKGLPFLQNLSLENSADFYLCFRLRLSFTKCLTSFSSIHQLLCLWARF